MNLFLKQMYGTVAVVHEALKYFLTIFSFLSMRAITLI